MYLLCRSSFGASHATDYGGNHGSDSAGQIVVSRATDHGRNRDGSEVPQVQFLWLWSSL